MSVKRDIIARVWERCLGRPFSLPEFVDWLVREGGYDMHEISREQLAALVEDRFEGDWREPEWSFNEILYYFDDSLDRKEFLDTEHAICWVGIIMIVGEIVRQGHSEWARHLYHVLNAITALRKTLRADECAAVLSETFRPR